jgi:hypothetical protein
VGFGNADDNADEVVGDGDTLVLVTTDSTDEGGSGRMACQPETLPSRIF